MIARAYLVAFALALLACGERGAGSANRSGAGAADSSQGGMANMPGMAMMPAMRGHMDSMAGLPPERMQTMMAAHQERASAMLDAMGADMRGMHMAPDPAWSALTDSVKRDLADLPGLSGKALAVRMREHQRRMRRLMDAHQQMMR